MSGDEPKQVDVRRVHRARASHEPIRRAGRGPTLGCLLMSGLATVAISVALVAGAMLAAVIMLVATVVNGVKALLGYRPRRSGGDLTRPPGRPGPGKED